MKLGRIRPAPRKPAPRKPAPAKPGGGLPYTGSVPKNDPFFKSKEFKNLGKDPANRFATANMYKSPYFGDVGSGSFGRAQDEAYRKFKNIPDPTPRMISPGPTPPSGGATGSTGFKSGFGGFDSNMFAPSGGAPGNPTGIIGGTGARASFGMKKGGEVKASKAPKASSASKRGDGIATKGKTKGRFV
jgi:hypothetical protein